MAGQHVLAMLVEVLDHLCVAYNGSIQARWALGHAARLARRCDARLTVVGIAPPVDEVIDERAELAKELLGADEHIRYRQRLLGTVAQMTSGVMTDVRVFTGPVASTMIDVVRLVRPDLVVLGARDRRRGARLLSCSLADALLAQAGCPVVLVRSPPREAKPTVLALVGRERDTYATLHAARMLAGSLSASLIVLPAPEHSRDLTGVAATACAGRRHQPLVAVVSGERLPGLRRRFGRSAGDAIGRGLRCPLVVAPRCARDGSSTHPYRLRKARRDSHMHTSQQPDSHAPRDATVRAPLTVQRSLLWQLFVANAIVLIAAVLVLILTPLRVSESVVVGEVLFLFCGLAVMLAVHLLLLRRTLGPLRRLTQIMGTVDPLRPGRRIGPGEAQTAEVAALGNAFNAMLDRLEDERRTSARRALAAQEEERLRIAREMHDQIGQTLTALTLEAERAAQAEGPVDRGVLERLANTALESLEDVRRIGRELRPEALDDLGLGNALIALCRRASAQSGLRVTPQLQPGLPALRPEVELVLYRVAQEGVTNALRHARASHVAVSLSGDDERIELCVRDNGQGLPDVVPEDTSGVSGMRERALLVGGRLSLGPNAVNGTIVHLDIPLGEALA